ncbi:MAG: type II and III secretion system protein [Sideroxyarcus sp.]|nr:type II and III secretion system protein [Sideroxyarcus sp.]
MRFTHALLCSACISLVACGTKSLPVSDKHIQQNNTPAAAVGSIPQPSKRAVVLPPPKPAVKVDTYSVVVTNVSAREILFALARDAKINIDIGPGIEGNVTLNAIDQTLPQILDRISKQVDMRYSIENGSLFVEADKPFLKTYKIDYVNMARDAEGGVAHSTQVGGAGNNSQLAIKNVSKNRFWETLVKNVTDILRETDKEIVVTRRASTAEEQQSTKADEPKSSSYFDMGATKPATDENERKVKTSEQDYKDYQTLQAASVISSPEAGIITVRATSKQHAKIQDFVTHVLRNTRRQVLIEATIAEVRLNSNYQQGIDWSRLRATGVTKGFQVTQTGTPGLPSANTGSMVLLNYVNPTSALGNLSASISLLDSFGDVKVLSSPKISVMNNQTAMLRVVDDLVYFTIDVKIVDPTPTTVGSTTYTSNLKTTPTGFTMSVTPQINDSDTVLLNLRPTITRLLGYVNDPNPVLAAAGVTSRIPQLQTREMESVLKIENNQIAVMGGLMQDEINNLSDGIPLLGDVPVAGGLFKNRNDTKTKTELVIFLRPVVIKDASLDGDFSEFRSNLPDENFLKPENEKAKP